MESRIFAGICGDFSSTNPLWRNRGEVERFFAGGMVERLWSGNEKLVEKSVENPANAGNGFHSLWKRLCTALHRRFHSGRRRIREISCGGEFFSPHRFPQLVENGVENRKFSVEKRWKARIFKEIPRFHRKRQTEKAGEKKKALRNRFSIRLLQLSSTGAAFSGTRMRCVLSLLL